jgi:hypothetical protein
MYDDNLGTGTTKGCERAVPQREWVQPALRKLTMTATAHSTKGGITADDGNSVGKGDLFEIS